jgi:putative hydrolase of the HAD superfamily
MTSNSLLDSRLPRAILVDLDDTIIVDDAVGEGAWQAACLKFAPFLNGITAQKLYAAIRETADLYWQDPEKHRKRRLQIKLARREVVRLTFSQLGIKNDDIADKLADTYSSEKDRLIAPFPGALDTLHYLKNRGFHLALLTNGGADIQRRKVERFGLEAIFDYILIEGEFGVGKPDERVYRSAMDKFNVSAKETWMIGDDLQRDLSGAQKLGIFSIWVDWRGTGLPSSSLVKPDHIIKTLKELSG